MRWRGLKIENYFVLCFAFSCTRPVFDSISLNLQQSLIIIKYTSCVSFCSIIIISMLHWIKMSLRVQLPIINYYIFLYSVPNLNCLRSKKMFFANLRDKQFWFSRDALHVRVKIKIRYLFNIFSNVSLIIKTNIVN